MSELTKKGHKTDNDADDTCDRVKRGMEEIEVGGMLGLEDHPEEEEDEATDAGDAVDGEEQVFADGPHLAYITAAAATVRKYGGGCSAAAARAPAVGRSRFRFPFLRRLRRRRYRHCLRRNRRIYVLKIKALRLLLNARIPLLRAVENDGDRDRDLKGGTKVLKGKAYVFS